MNLKKFTALFLVSFASIIMLAFAVMPHHHHGEYLCFEAAHCETQVPVREQTSGKNTSDAHHGCVRNLFQTHITRNSSPIHTCDKGECPHFIETLFVLSDILNFLSSEAENKFLFSGFYQEKLHATYFISDLSGRAPPYQGEVNSLYTL